MSIDNLKLIEECFRQARISGELCDASILKYQDSIKKFFAVVNEKSIEDLALRDFDDFILTMRDNEASNSRIANVISAIKWLIARLQTSGAIVNTLDLEKVKKPKIDRKEVNYLTEQEIKSFTEAIENDTSKGPKIRKARFVALTMFLLQTGARIGEVLSIKISDIDRSNKEISIIGKGKKPRTLLLRPETIVYIDQYLSMRNDDSVWLFVTLDGKTVWSQTDVGRSFRRYKALSGIRKKFTIHTLRHTFATQLLLGKVPMNAVQYFLGHSNLETTMKYYIGALNKDQARQFMTDGFFKFIPGSEVENISHRE